MATELNVKLNNTLDGTSLKAIQDKNNNDIVDTYFPKSGGIVSMSTNLTEKNVFILRRDCDDGSINITAGTNSKEAEITGARLLLHGMDQPIEKGHFNLLAVLNEDTKSYYKLVGRGDGRLTWGTATTSNNLAGSAIVAQKLSSHGYIKYANGLILQWGEIDIGTSTTTSTTSTIRTFTVVYPITFETNVYQVMCCHDLASNLDNNDLRITNSVWVNDKKTSFIIYVTRKTSGWYGHVRWFAIGK